MPSATPSPPDRRPALRMLGALLLGIGGWRFIDSCRLPAISERGPLLATAMGLLLFGATALVSPPLRDTPWRRLIRRLAFWRMAAFQAALLVVAYVAFRPLGDSSKADPADARRVAILGALALAVFLPAWALFSIMLMRWVAASSAPGGLSRAFDLSCFNLLLVGALCEAGLRAAALFSSNPYLSSPSNASEDDLKFIDRWRLKPEWSVFGFKPNSRGYYDEEFAPKTPDMFRIVALGDSFAVGVVPHSFNFLTLLEKGLNGWAGGRRIDICDMGVHATNPRHYYALLKSEGIYLQPDLVMACLFLGNDFSGHGVGDVYAGRWDVFMTYRVVERMIRATGAEPPPASRRAESQSDVIPPYLRDWRLEPPTLPLDQYMMHERSRAQFFDPRQPDSLYDGAIESLLKIQEQAMTSTGRPAVVIVIPDEMQVNPVLRARLEEEMGIALDLTKPMRYLRKRLEPMGLVVIDLLDALQRGEGELGRVYHLQDTHWNANGNRIAADEIARQLRAHPELKQQGSR